MSIELFYRVVYVLRTGHSGASDHRGKEAFARAAANMAEHVRDPDVVFAMNIALDHGIVTDCIEVHHGDVSKSQ